MSKRKFETADAESGTLEQSKKAKKQKTDTSSPQPKSISITANGHPENESLSQISLDRRKEKHLRRLAKREIANGHPENKRYLQAHTNKKKEKRVNRLGKRGTKISKESRREESASKNGIKTVVDDGNVVLTKTEKTQLSEKLRKEKRHESRQLREEGVQVSIGRHQSKKGRRRDRSARSDGKQGKRQSVETATWKISDPVGGQMLDMDPVFSPDEK